MRGTVRERLDRPPVVHRRVCATDAVEIGFKVEDTARVEVASEDLFEEFGNVDAGWGDTPRQPTLRKNVVAKGTPESWGTPTMPTVEPGRAILNAVATDWPVPTHSIAASTPTPSVSSRTAAVASSPRSATMSEEPKFLARS